MAKPTHSVAPSYYDDNGNYVEFPAYNNATGIDLANTYICAQKKDGSNELEYKMVDITTDLESVYPQNADKVESVTTVAECDSFGVANNLNGALVTRNCVFNTKPISDENYGRYIDLSDVLDSKGMVTCIDIDSLYSRDGESGDIKTYTDYAVKTYTNVCNTVYVDSSSLITKKSILDNFKVYWKFGNSTSGTTTMSKANNDLLPAYYMYGFIQNVIFNDSGTVSHSQRYIYPKISISQYISQVAVNGRIQKLVGFKDLEQED